MTSRSTWKSLERKAARLLKGQRNPLSGANSKHTAGDVIHDTLYIECKLRAKWGITTIFQEVRQAAINEGKVPLLVIKEKGKHSELAIMDIQDLLKLIRESVGHNDKSQKGILKNAQITNENPGRTREQQKRHNK